MVSNYLTKKDSKSFSKNWNTCTIKRQEVADRLRETSDGRPDWRNAEYEAAKEWQALLKGAFRSWGAFSNRKNHTWAETFADFIQIGSTVTIQEGSEDKETLVIVGAAEAHPGEGRISHESPFRKGAHLVLEKEI